MHHFRYAGQNLQCEGVDLAEIARLYGTPTYVYSTATMADNYTRLAAGLKGLDLQICYAMKANSNIAILRHFANLGAGFDLVSGGEIRRVLAAGGDIKRRSSSRSRTASSPSTWRASPRSPASITSPASSA
jgi:diaminopimelate decarboxylase